MNGLSDANKRSQFLLFLKNLKSDIYFLQETHAVSRLPEWEGLSFFKSGTNLSCGVAVLFQPGFKPKILDVKRDFDGRLISIKLSFQNQIFTLLNIYAPNIPARRKEFFANLHSFFFSGSQLCIDGDFNCIMSDLDKQGGNIDIGFDGKEEIISLMKDFHMLDFWRSKNPTTRTYSWHNADFSIACRLDRFLISKSLVKFTRSCEYLVCPHSDHDCVVLKVGSYSFRKRNLWKFDNTLLRDSDFCEQIKNLFSIWNNRID